MKIFSIFILAILIVSILTSCAEQTKLPKELPSNAEIIYVSEGGLNPSFFKINISGSMMKVTSQTAGQSKEVKVWEAKLSDEELKKLYNVFIDNKFDSIKPEQITNVVNGGFRSIELKFEQKRFYAISGNGADSAENSAERFANIENALGDLVKKYDK